MPSHRLLIATHNQGKVREYQYLLRDLPLELISLDDVGISEDVDETGTTFLENAWLKAHTYSRLGGILTLSDDSGLEVDALGGQPGIHSARYGGDSCHSDEDRIALLLSNMLNIPWAQRTARFRCCIAICQPQGAELSVVGSVAGNDTIPTEGFRRIWLRSGILPPILWPDHVGTFHGGQEPDKSPRRRDQPGSSGPGEIPGKTLTVFPYPYLIHRIYLSGSYRFTGTFPEGLENFGHRPVQFPLHLLHAGRNFR